MHFIKNLALPGGCIERLKRFKNKDQEKQALYFFDFLFFRKWTSFRMVCNQILADCIPTTRSAIKDHVFYLNALKEDTDSVSVFSV